MTTIKASAVRHYRYDTERSVQAGDWLIASDPDRYWLIVAARQVRPHPSHPHRYRWRLTCELRQGPTEDAPWLPNDFPTTTEEIHRIEFYRRTPRRGHR
jgi:hypothetical protein